MNVCEKVAPCARIPESQRLVLLLVEECAETPVHDHVTESFGPMATAGGLKLKSTIATLVPAPQAGIAANPINPASDDTIQPVTALVFINLAEEADPRDTSDPLVCTWDVQGRDLFRGKLGAVGALRR